MLTTVVPALVGHGSPPRSLFYLFFVLYRVLAKNSWCLFIRHVKQAYQWSLSFTLSVDEPDSVWLFAWQKSKSIDYKMRSSFSEPCTYELFVTTFSHIRKILRRSVNRSAAFWGLLLWKRTKLLVAQFFSVGGRSSDTFSNRLFVLVTYLLIMPKETKVMTHFHTLSTVKIGLQYCLAKIFVMNGSNTRRIKYYDKPLPQTKIYFPKVASCAVYV